MGGLIFRRTRRSLPKSSANPSGSTNSTDTSSQFRSKALRHSTRQMARKTSEPRRNVRLSHLSFPKIRQLQRLSLSGDGSISLHCILEVKGPSVVGPLVPTRDAQGRQQNGFLV